MRRRSAVAVGAVVAIAMATLMLTGCARPSGVDGNLADDWPAMPAAKTPVPVAGVCYREPYSETWLGDFDPVDCATQPHQTETAYVGAFTGGQADRSTPPLADGVSLAGEYAQCQRAASDYLGGDWHTALVGLKLVLPSPAAWSVDARWYRCDLLHYFDPYGSGIVQDGTLKGDLSGPRTAAYGCLAVVLDKDRAQVSSMKPIDCAQPHNVEFAGFFTAPETPWPSDTASRQKLGTDGCENVVAKFLGYANVGQWHNAAIGWWESNFDEDQWALGDRTASCFAFAFTRSGNFVGSVKGLRDQAPRG
jgi:hypothetical protein